MKLHLTQQKGPKLPHEDAPKLQQAQPSAPSLQQAQPSVPKPSAPSLQQPDEKKPAAAYSHDWSEKVEELLHDWRLRVYAAQSAHYAAADRFRLMNYVVGVPAIIFSSIVGTAIFAGFEHEQPASGVDIRTIIVGSASILAAVLAGLQTFLRFSERAGAHATAADWYSAIRRDNEQTLHLSCDGRGKAKDCLDRVRKEMNRAGQDAPELNVRLWKREAERFGVKEPLKAP
jgi:hypothetical protein